MAKFPDKIFDAAIVGGGPAGSSAAIRLAAAGLRVLLVEQKKFPRQKLCGEFISPECLVHFDELGVLQDISAAGGVDLRETVFFARSGKGVAVKSEWFGQTGSFALGLSRAEMDARLLRHALESGVDVREQTTAAGLLFDEMRVSGVRLRDGDRIEKTIQARVVIDATGRTRSLARRIDNPAGDKKRARHVAFKTHLRDARVTASRCEIFAYRGGYGGCSRVENDLYNLCFIASAEDTLGRACDPERVLREVVFTNRRAAETLQNATIADEWHAVAIERFGRGILVPAEGLLTIGDAAAFIDPFTGSGILLALESSKIAASAIAKSFSENADFHSLAREYRRNYAVAFDQRLRVCSILRHASFAPFLAEATISLLSLSGGLRRRIARATRFSTG